MIIVGVTLFVLGVGLVVISGTYREYPYNMLGALAFILGLLFVVYAIVYAAIMELVQVIQDNSFEISLALLLTGLIVIFLVILRLEHEKELVKKDEEDEDEEDEDEVEEEEWICPKCGTEDPKRCEEGHCLACKYSRCRDCDTCLACAKNYCRYCKRCDNCTSDICAWDCYKCY